MLKLILVLILSTLVNGYSQEFTFKFNPPDCSFKQILDTKKTTMINGKQDKDDEIIVESLIELKKKEDGTGYKINQRPMKMNSKRDGKAFQNPLFIFLTQIPTSGDIDNNGNLINVYGFEKLVMRAQKELPPEVAESINQVANEQSMINKTKAEWNARISDFAGQTVQIGDMFSGEGRFPLPNGETITFFSVVKIADTITYNGKKCVKIKFTNNTDPSELANFMGQSIEEVKSVFNFSANDNVGTPIKISGEGYRIIDPETMLIYYEINNRYVDMKSDIIGDESTDTRTAETKEYKYEY